MKLKDMTLVSSEGGILGTSRLWKLSTVLVFIGLVAYIIGFSTNRWAGLDDEEVDKPPTVVIVNSHFGLWRKCEKVTEKTTQVVLQDKCQDMDNDDAYKPAAKALCSLGLIFGIFGVLGSLVGGCYHSNKMMAFGGVLTVFGAVVSAVGAAVFVGKARDENDDLEPYYSVFFALIGALVMIIGGGIQLLSIKTGYSTIA